jgi:predicted phosphodiesterase
LEYRRGGRFFDEIVCPLLVGIGGTKIGKGGVRIWEFYDEKAKPKVLELYKEHLKPWLQKRLSKLKAKFNPSIHSLKFKELVELVELLYLDGLLPHEVEILAEHMMLPLKERMKRPLLGRDLFISEALISNDLIPEKFPDAPEFSDMSYDPAVFYSKLLSISTGPYDFRHDREYKEEMDEPPVERKASGFMNIIGPAVFDLVPPEGMESVRTSEIPEYVIRRDHWFREMTFQIIDSILLLGDWIYKEIPSSMLLNDLVMILLEYDMWADYATPPRDGWLEAKLREREIILNDKNFEYNAIANLNEVLVERNHEKPSHTLGILERAEASLGLRDKEWLVYGHTHQPFLQHRLINLGSWMKFSDRISQTFLLVNKGEARLCSYPLGQITGDGVWSL